MQTGAPLTEEYKLLLRDLAQVSNTLLDTRTGFREAVNFLKLSLIQEALKRSKRNRCLAARMLKINRNTLTRNLPVAQRRENERYLGRKRVASAVAAPARITLPVGQLTG